MPETPVPPTPSIGAVHPGQTLAGRYALDHLIARGGMADVWQATDTLLERQVAVKILHPHLAADAGFVARFRTEAVAAARLHHRAIVSIFDTCSEHGVEAIVMELIRGHTLREEFDTHGPMEPRVVIDIGADVADALQASHNAGLIHRDVKPANILLCDDQRVMVTDFGIAKVQDNTDHTQVGTMLGSVKYLSPEQVEGFAVDARSDVYSLGVVLYEALTGRVPFIGDTPAATALARLHTIPTPPRQVRPGISEALDAVVMKALAREPAQRFNTAAAMRDAVIGARSAPIAVDPDITEVSPSPVPVAAKKAVSKPRPRSSPPPPPRVHPKSRRSWGAALSALILVGIALAVAGVLVLRSNTTKKGADDASQTSTTIAANAALKLQSPPRSFDPSGDNSENDGQLANAVDDNPATAWHTEYYNDRKFSSSATKTGVGIVVATNRATDLAQLKVSSPTQDWAAQVFVSDTDKTKAALADWGAPIDTKTGIKGDAVFDLHGTKGQYVLLWITDLGSGPPAPGTTGPPDVTVLINELTAVAAT